jgi:predicted DNA-binding transcriptional regulator YafY
MADNALMDRTERLYRIEQLLRERPPVPVETFLEELEVSIATFKRDLEYLRDRLNAPIVWERRRGYRFADSAAGPVHELPGLWFNATEIHALLTMRQLLKDLQPGLLEPHVQPLLTRLNALLESGGPQPLGEVENRVRIFHIARRSLNLRHFELVASALLKRQRLHIRHFNRQSGATLEREVSPQRLIHYRENWYLDAWCHLRQSIRSFAVDAIESAVLLQQPAKEVADAELDRVLAAGYGIFSGAAVQWAILRFSPERARWVGQETWHPGQKGTFEPDGSYRLETPYSDDRELLMDILRHGPEVEVVAPPELRDRVLTAIGAMQRVYDSAKSEK